MQADDRCSESHYDTSISELGYDNSVFFEKREPITLEEVEQLIATAASLGTTRVATAPETSQLEVMKPNGELLPRDQADADAWGKLAQHSSSTESYEAGIAARLDLIACAGGAEVGSSDLSSDFARYIARGLLRVDRFDDAGSNKPRLIDMLKTAMKTGKKPDGSPCPGAVGLDDEDFRK